MKIGKRLLVLTLVFALVLVMSACGGGGGEGGDKEAVVLKFHHAEPPTDVSGLFFQKWADEVTANSNGTLKVDVYPGAALGAAQDSIDMLLNGTCDIAWSVPAYFQGRFPMTDVMYLPMMGMDNGPMASQVFWDIYAETDYMDKEYEQFKVIALFCHADVPISLKGKKVEKLADFKGLKFRVAGGIMTDYVKELGASPVSIPAPDIYTSLERGVINGTVADWHLIDAFKLYEQTEYYLDAKIYSGPLFILMNKDVYESLPEEAKKAIDDYSGQVCVTEIANEWSSTRDECMEGINANNGEVYEPSAELIAEMTKAAEPVWEKWIKENEAKGLPAQKVFDFVKNAANDPKYTALKK
ncbi:MAG: TRAP transporter substrate-binding protein [Desulfitobacteriia bacterium]|jgi:TRAP-type C4-dicarboxylate transport system substrate-binding protein